MGFEDFTNVMCRAVLPTTVAAVGRRVLIGVALLVMADYCAADLSQLVHKV